MAATVSFADARAISPLPVPIYKRAAGANAIHGLAPFCYIAAQPSIHFGVAAPVLRDLVA